MISVLVIDDDRSVRDSLTEFLHTLGYSVTCAPSAADGRKAAAANAPDVALVDLRLPDARSPGLLDDLRADAPEVGVIMLTGHADVPAALRAVRQGALDYLEKPVNLEALHASVSRAVELVRLRREVRQLRSGAIAAQPVSESLVDGPLSLAPDLSLAEAERQAIRRALEATGGNRLRAAGLLQVARSTLQEKLKRLDAR